MDFRAKFKKINLPKAFDDLNIQKLFNFSKKVDSAIIIDIDRSKLTLCDVSFADRIRIKSLKVVELKSDKKNEIISESLAVFIKDNDIQHNNVFLIPKLDSLLIKRLQLPAMPQEEIADALKWEIKEDIPYDIAEAILDYKIINRDSRPGEPSSLDIVCVWAREKEVKEQAFVLRQLGLKCLAVVPLPFIYPKFVSQYEQDNDAPVSILHIGEDKCYIVICNDKQLEFYRELPLSIDKLKECLTGVLTSESGEVSISAEKAEKLLFSVGIPQKEAIYEDKVSSTQILAMLRPILERLVQEIKRSLNYYYTELKNKGARVNRIFLGGQAKKIPNLDMFLKQELDLETKNIDISNKIEVSANTNRQILLEKIETLAIALSYKKGINLLPYEFRTEEIEKMQKVSLRWTTFIVSLLLIVSYIFTKVEIVSYRKRLDNALLHLEVISEVKKMKADRDALNNFISDLRTKEPPVGTLLKVLSSISDREVYFNEFTLASDSKQGFVSGFVKSTKNNPDAILANFVDRMAKTKYFSSVEISSVKKRKEAPFDITEFNLNFQVP